MNKYKSSFRVPKTCFGAHEVHEASWLLGTGTAGEGVGCSLKTGNRYGRSHARDAKVRPRRLRCADFEGKADKLG
eukprot:365374-Chlamydomonas_euryale.AAC.9